MIHKTLKVESDTISIDVPKNYIGKILEIIAFSADEAVTDKSLDKSIPAFNALSLDTRGFKFNREEANER